MISSAHNLCSPAFQVNDDGTISLQFPVKGRKKNLCLGIGTPRDLTALQKEVFIEGSYQMFPSKLILAMLEIGFSMNVSSEAVVIPSPPSPIL